jgi:hypothetical protein
LFVELSSLVLVDLDGTVGETVQTVKGIGQDADRNGTIAVSNDREPIQKRS